MKTITITGGRPGEMLTRSEGSVEMNGVLTEPEKLIVSGPETMQISDGYHTLDELYDHRITLFIALCRSLRTHKVWRAKLHADGSGYQGWFVMGINDAPGKQISYHLPMDRWDETEFAFTLDRAPQWDGHSPADVLARLKQL